MKSKLFSSEVSTDEVGLDDCTLCMVMHPSVFIKSDVWSEMTRQQDTTMDSLQ